MGYTRSQPKTIFIANSVNKYRIDNAYISESHTANNHHYWATWHYASSDTV